MPGYHTRTRARDQFNSLCLRKSTTSSAILDRSRDFGLTQSRDPNEI